MIQLRNLIRSLREPNSEARYCHWLDASHEGLAIHDGGTLLDANPVFEAMIGAPLAQTRGQPLSPFVSPPDRDILSATFTAGADTPREATLTRADGASLRVEVLAKPMTYAGRDVRALAFRPLVERLETQAERLELSLEREKSRVLLRYMSNLSHDLRTPLTVMKTALYLLKRLIDDPEQRDHQLEVLQAQTEHLRRLMDDILNMSRLDRADLDEFHFEPTRLNDVLAASLSDQKVLAARKKHALSFHPHDPLPLISADARQVRRMLNHVLLNAINYTPDGGSITVSSDQSGDHVLIRVQDSGIGIASDDLPSIYDYFYRAESARASHQGGTGLGLSIAHKIVEAHGGLIEAASNPGQGTTFTIRLPLVPPEAS